jgi:hypothetical protein
VTHAPARLLLLLRLLVGVWEPFLLLLLLLLLLLGVQVTGPVVQVNWPCSARRPWACWASAAAAAAGASPLHCLRAAAAAAAAAAAGLHVHANPVQHS